MTITFLQALVRRCQAKLNTLLGTFFLCLEKSILHIRLALLPLAHFVKQKNLPDPSPKRLNEREKNNFYDYGQQITDIYAECSIDYVRNAKTTRKRFQYGAVRPRSHLSICLLNFNKLGRINPFIRCSFSNTYPI